MAKNDLFKKDWLDIVFENRNKEYGAYKLRKDSSYTTIISLVAGLFLFCAVFIIPSVVSNLFASNDPGVIVLDVPLTPKDLDKEMFIPKDEPEVEVIEVKVKATLSKDDIVKYKAFDPSKVDEVTEEAPNTDAFLNANPGSENIKGDEDGDIVLNEKPVDKVEDVVVSDVTKGVERDDTVYFGVSHKAEPYGSMGKFSSEFVSKFRTPEMDAGTKEIKVIMSFIVEKDGSLTDIKVLRDPGYGASKEAIRVLRTMSKWKPAMNNDKPVRSQFTLPITIKVQ